MSDARWSLHFAWGRAPYALDLPEIVIGRGEACSLQIEDPASSDEHARFIVDDDEQVWLEDLESGTPTLINGRVITQRTLLTDGDFVQIGHAVLTLRANATRPALAAAPDARTVSASEVPDEVRRVIAARGAASKNFVVGCEQPSALATLMMESPILAQAVQPPATRTREAQQTVEVNAEDILASIRRDPPPPVAVAESAPPSYEPAGVTIAMQAVAAAPSSQPTLQMETLQGIGPSPGPRELAAAPTMIAGMPAPSLSPPPAASSPAKQDLASASTMIAEAPAPRQRGSTMSDITPLPAPLPAPTASIPDLEPLVRAITNKHPTHDDSFLAPQPGDATRAEKKPTQRSNVETQLNTPAPTLSALATQQLMAVRDPQTDSLAMQPTALPTQVPPEVAALQSGQRRAASQKQPVAAMPAPSSSGSYTPPKKGLFGAYSRAFDFFQQMFALGKRERLLMKPIINNILIATPIMAALSVLLLFVHGARAVYGIMSLGVTVLYFVDYASNALTASLMYDYVTTGKADLASAKARVKHSAQGILIFAAVSALLDVGSTYARERRDLVSKILLRILHAIWTTATYVIMPAMIIEGISFKDAFARSKKLMDHDPTGVGAGVVALSLVTYMLAAIVFPVAYTLMSIGSRVHPVLGMMLFFGMVNVYWAVSGWLKIAYSTCFYMWARQCEAQGSTDSALAPLPLRHALDAG